MKNLILFIFSLLFVHSMTSAQTLDSASLVCLYHVEYINDIQNPQNVKREEMMLLVGDNFSSFYSYTNFFADSLRTANPSEYMPRTTNVGGNMQILPAPKNAPKSAYHDKLYIERSKGELCCLTKILKQYYQYNEQLEIPNWKIESSTSTVLGYQCQKATASYKGRNWIVWFTPEIPISEGPWKLRGLPGLILKAEDSEKHYSFECTGIERLAPPRPIIKDKRVTYQAVTKKEYDRLYSMFFNDPSSYLESILGGKITVTISQGKRVYNPIEKIE